MSNLVVYKDELNTVPLRSFNSKEMDLFFSICSKMRNEELNIVTFDFEDLKELSNYKMTATNHFVSDLESIYSKLIQLDFRIETEEKIIKFVLFTKYEIDKKKQTISIRINEEFKDILNSIIGGFTKFELEEFTMLSSSYSKTAYRLLKQFRQTGYYIVKIDEFRRLLDIPESYQMNNIDQRVLKPIEREIAQHFENLEINKLKGKGRRKRFIEYIEFKFKAETDVENGDKLFRNKETGEYYKKDIMDFNDEEIKKTYPGVKPLSDFLVLKDQMGLTKEKFTEKQINEIYNTAMNKVMEEGVRIDIFEYIKLNYEDLKSKYPDKVKIPGYLNSAMKGDYAKAILKLGQIKI